MSLKRRQAQEGLPRQESDYDDANDPFAKDNRLFNISDYYRMDSPWYFCHVATYNE